MGNFTRRGAGAAMLAGAMVLTPLAAIADDDSVIIDIDGAPEYITPDPDPDIYRFAGPDRVATAIEAAERTNGLWGSEEFGKYAIVANTDIFADALAATPLADEIDAPVLLSAPGNQLDSRVIAYLVAEGYDGVILAGGDGVFGEGVVAQLNNNGLEGHRVSGANRYQTAVMLAGAAIEADWASDSPEMQNPNIFLASGNDFPDALVAGAAAAHNSGVVLLTQDGRGLDSVTYGFVTGADMQWEFDMPWSDPDGWSEPQNHTALIAVGGPASRAADMGWLNDPVELDDRVVGPNRYETAVMVNQEYIGDTGNYVVASGQNFPDAVVAGAYAANIDGGMLLTRHDALPGAVVNFFTQSYKRETIDNIFVFGGTGSVAQYVSEQLRDLPWDY